MAVGGFVAFLAIVATVGALTDASRSVSAFLLAVTTIAATAGISLALTMRRTIREGDVDGMTRLEQAARTDSLTSLGNHRAFQEDLASEVANKDPRRKPLSLVMLDMDGLKRANDTLGHKAGDDMIRQLAGVLGDTMRAGDRAYRVGGDEFAVILLKEPTWGAFGFSQRLQGNLRALGVEPRVSASAGIAESREQDPEELIRHADLALIAAKHSRRGALIYSDDLDPTHRDETAGYVDRRGDASVVIAGALGKTADELLGIGEGHSERVAELCAMIARELGLDPLRVARIRLAGLLANMARISDPGDRESDSLGHRLIVNVGFPDEANWIAALGADKSDPPIERTIVMIADSFAALVAVDGAPGDTFELLRQQYPQAAAQACVDALQRVLDQTAIAVD